MASLARLLLASAAALAATWLPVASVVACDCEMRSFEESVREADIAIVGTAEAFEVARPVDFDPVPVAIRWEVERSRDPLPADTVTIWAWPDMGANCGITFGSGERWLVLADAGEQGLETNSCLPNQRFDGSDPKAEESIEAIITSVPADSEPTAGPSVPGPILIGTAALLAITGVSVVAFRRSR